MDVDDDQPPASEQPESREPSAEDLAQLCRELNSRGARYLVVGGFAMRAAGYDRRTMDIDLLIEGGVDNERRVLDALATLPDRAAREIKPGEVSEYAVIRVADEIVVDLMTAASGVDYAEAALAVEIHEVAHVPIPFASARLLWRMKKARLRDKDAPDIHFLRLLLQRRGEAAD